MSIKMFGGRQRSVIKLETTVEEINEIVDISYKAALVEEEEYGSIISEWIYPIVMNPEVFLDYIEQCELQGTLDEELKDKLSKIGLIARMWDKYSELPKCDLIKTSEAICDASLPTHGSQWGYLSREVLTDKHLGVKLGMGSGQLLIK